MGPLSGIRVVEFAGIGPCPMAAMMLAEMGATVLRIDRVADSDLGIPLATKFETLKRSRHIIRLDLKRPAAVALTLRLIEQSDALIEGFRPKVMERLGVGPDVCLARNPRLVFGRVTGWGQEGPLSHAAGHDLNYIALTGALDTIGRAGAPPTPPLNGRRFRRRGALSGRRCARRDHRGAAVRQGPGRRSGDRGRRVLADDFDLWWQGIWPARRAAWHQYHRLRRVFLRGLRMRRRPLRLGLGGDRGQVPRRTAAASGDRSGAMPPQMDRSRWPETKAQLAARFCTRTRDEWCSLLEGSDACFAPVLSMDEAAHHPHNRARSAFVELDRRGAARAGATVQPHAARSADVARATTDTRAVLAEWGISAAEAAAAHADGILV